MSDNILRVPITDVIAAFPPIVQDIARRTKEIGYSSAAEWIVLGVASGGAAPAHMLARHLETPVYKIHYIRPGQKLAFRPEHSIIIDDIYDSGATLAPWIAEGFPCYALYARNGERALADGLAAFGHDLEGATQYLQFPWENEMGPEDAVRRLLQYIGRDVSDASVAETPRRYLSWLNEFREDQPLPKMTKFEGVSYDEMISVSDLTFTSLCEHHLLPFTGRAHVGYIPTDGGNIIGLSKLARVVEWASRRTQVQERMTEEIRQAIAEATGSDSVGVVVEAEHMCMGMRGIRKPGHTTTTSSLSGAFRTEPETRAEFLKLARSR